MLANLFVLLIVAGLVGLWRLAKSIKTVKQQRIFTLFLAAVIGYMLINLWLFTSPDPPGSEPRAEFELWRLVVTVICILIGVPAIIALVVRHKKSDFDH